MPNKNSPPVVIVTGGSGGIGGATAKAFAARGYAVAIHYNHNQLAAERLAAELNRTYSVSAIVLKGNLADEEEAMEIVDETVRHLGGLDVLVNIAGISPKKENGARMFTEETNGDMWDRVMEVNLKSMFMMCKAVIPFMKRNQKGKIVNMSSIVGRTGLSGPAGTPYAASKGAIITLTKTLARELAGNGIHVNSVAPGWILTPLTAEILAAESLLRDIPLGRYGHPDEVAAAIAFLASPEADYITGVTLDINGGWHID